MKILTCTLLIFWIIGNIIAFIYGATIGASYVFRKDCKHNFKRYEYIIPLKRAGCASSKFFVQFNDWLEEEV